MYLPDFLHLSLLSFLSFHFLFQLSTFFCKWRWTIQNLEGKNVTSKIFLISFLVVYNEKENILKFLMPSSVQLKNILSLYSSTRLLYSWICGLCSGPYPRLSFCLFPDTHFLEILLKSLLAFRWCVAGELVGQNCQKPDNFSHSNIFFYEKPELFFS